MEISSDGYHESIETLTGNLGVEVVLGLGEPHQEVGEVPMIGIGYSDRNDPNCDTISISKDLYPYPLDLDKVLREGNKSKSSFH